MVVAAVMILGSGAALAVEKKAPEAGPWEYQLALETGKLPASDSVNAQKKSGPADESVPMIEVGGRVYRVGVDTEQAGRGADESGRPFSPAAGCSQCR